MQKIEVRSQKSEVRGQMTDVGVESVVCRRIVMGCVNSLLIADF
jgi:DNA-directed RNA polymerase subunit N (RpoN/RPB10)